jgi:hypothetical protein
MKASQVNGSCEMFGVHVSYALHSPAVGRARRAVLIVVVFLLGLHNPLVAQHAGLPVDHSPAHRRVAGGHLDFGQSGGFAGTGALRSLGVRGHVAAGRYQLTLGGHSVSPEANGLEDGIGLGATIALQLEAANLLRTANVQAGFGIVHLGREAGGSVTMIDLPLSLAVGLDMPTRAGPAETWIAPRLHVRHLEISESDEIADGTRVGAGASAGLRFTFDDAHAGFGLALDGMGLPDPQDDEWRFIAAFALSLHLLLDW